MTASPPGSSDAQRQHRDAAVRALDTLMERLRTRAGDPEVRTALETGEHLGRAVRAFHLEAIRFRMFGLTRFLERTTLEDAADLRALAAEVRESLERAGFQTRSL